MDLDTALAGAVGDDQTKGTLTYVGDDLKFQNGFGAWAQMTYSCIFDPATKTVLPVEGHARAS
jgi:hypothetical protein